MKDGLLGAGLKLLPLMILNHNKAKITPIEPSPTRISPVNGTFDIVLMEDAAMWFD